MPTFRNLTDYTEIVASSSDRVLLETAAGDPRGTHPGSLGYLVNIVGDTTPELGGTLDCLDEVVSSPELQDYSETSPTQSGVTGGLTLDFAAGPHHEITHGAGNITSVTINNWPASGKTGALTVDYVQDGTGGRTVVHPTGIVWAGGSPTFDTAAGKTNRVTYVTRDGGTEIVGHYGGAW